MAGTPQVPNRIANMRFISAMNVEDGLTANSAGTQAAGYQMSAQVSRFSTVGGAGYSAVLPKISAITPQDENPAWVGFIAIVRNDGANSMQVFGPTPDTINGVATATGVAVGNGKTAMFVATSYNPTTNVGNWVMILSA